MIDVLLGTGPANARPILIFLFFTLIASNPPHYMHPPLSLRVFPPHRGLFTRGLALPEGRACPRCPHRGLDPRSPAIINTEVPRHRDYN